MFAATCTWIFGGVGPVLAAQGLMADVLHIVVTGACFVAVSIYGRKLTARYQIQQAEKIAVEALEKSEADRAALAVLQAEMAALKGEDV